MRQTKNILCLLAMLWLAMVPAHAGGNAKLVVELTNGETHEFVLAQKPVVSFEGGAFVIESTDFAIHSTFTYASVNKLYFDTVDGEEKPDTPIEDGVEEVKTPTKNRFTYTFAGNMLDIQGIEADLNQVAVYAVNGTRMNTDITRSGQGIRIHTGHLPAGIYVIKAGSRSLKIVKK